MPVVVQVMLTHRHRSPGAPLCSLSRWTLALLASHANMTGSRPQSSLPRLECIPYPALQEVMHLTAAVAKELPALEEAGCLGGAVPPLLGLGMLRAAACASCNHKDLAAAALQCLAAVVGEAGAFCHTQLPC